VLVWAIILKTAPPLLTLGQEGRKLKFLYYNDCCVLISGYAFMTYKMPKTTGCINENRKNIFQQLTSVW
jgi:hypothetical protein